MKTSKPEQGKTNRKRRGTKEKAQEIHIDTETHTFVHTENPQNKIRNRNTEKKHQKVNKQTNKNKKKLTNKQQQIPRRKAL